MAYEIIFAPGNEKGVAPIVVLLAKEALWASCQPEGETNTFYGFYCEDAPDGDFCHRIVSRLDADQCQPAGNNKKSATASDEAILAQAEIKQTINPADPVQMTCPPGEYYGQKVLIRHIPDPPIFDLGYVINQDLGLEPQSMN